MLPSLEERNLGIWLRAGANDESAVLPRARGAPFFVPSVRYTIETPWASHTLISTSWLVAVRISHTNIYFHAYL